jgi:glycosyltransferase involved in cell wall biosynthesis
LPSNATGEGIARYSFELLSHLRKDLDLCLIAPRKLTHNHIELATEEFSSTLNILRVNADLYHAMSPVGGKTAILTRKKPLITTIHDVLPFFARIYPSYFALSYHRLSTLIATKSDVIIVTCNSTKNFLVSLLKIDPEKVKVILMGIDLKSFHPLPKTSDGIKRILFIGSTHQKLRGVDILLRAFAIVVKKVRNVELLIGGKGKGEDFVAGMIKALKISDKVKILGFIPERALLKYYNLADLYVYPSRIGFSFSLFEAMACGTPVIASNSFNSPELVGDGGLLVESDNINQLANAMLTVLTDEKTSKDLINRGTQWVKHMSWERTAKETFNLYNEVLECY